MSTDELEILPSDSCGEFPTNDVLLRSPQATDEGGACPEAYEFKIRMIS